MPERPWIVGEWLAAVEAEEPPTKEDVRCVIEMLSSKAFCRVAGEMLRRQRERALGTLLGLSPWDPVAVHEAQMQLRLVQLVFERLEEVINGD